MKTCPFTRLKKAIAQYSPRLVLRRYRLKSITLSLDQEALATWRSGHEVFFVLIQGAALELRRFKSAVVDADLAAAMRHIDRATAILVGSATAMRLAGDVDRTAYAKVVMPAMVKAHPRFSGSDSADHDFLISTYKDLVSIVSRLPAELTERYNRFIIAVDTAIAAHVEVCAVHRGNDRESSGSGASTVLTGVETLMRIGAKRLMLLMPKANCPMHAAAKRARADSATKTPTAEEAQ